MSFANVNIGSGASTGDGDSLRSAFNKINQNFANIAESRLDITVDAPVQSVNNQTGDVLLTVSDIAGATTKGYVDAQTEYAIATARGYTNSSIGDLLDSAPGALNTLNELAAAMNDDPNFAATVTNRIAVIETDLTTIRSESSGLLAQEITQISSELDDETSRAIAAEAALQLNIDSARSDLDASDANIESLLNTEISNRDTAVNAVQTNLDTETQARIDADSDLQTQINNIVSNIDPAALYSLTEIVAAFQSTDGDLTATVNNLQTSLSANITAVQDDLDSEILARLNADSSLDSKLEAADTSLQANIDALSTTLTNYVDAEIAAIPATDLTGLATETYVDISIAAIPPTDLTGLATETFVTDAIAAIPAPDFTGLATETYVGTAVANLVDTAPTTLNTLNELAAALGNDADFATRVFTQIGLKADITYVDQEIAARQTRDSQLETGIDNVSANLATLTGRVDSIEITKANIADLNIANWNTAYGWGDHSQVGYLTSYTETDPEFTAWDKSTGISITESQITDLQSYLTSYTETDPVVGAVTGIVKADGAGNITAAVAGTDYSIFDGAYSSLSGAPALATVATSGDYNDLINRPSSDTGNFTFDSNTLGVSGTDASITINANGIGDIVMNDYVGIKQDNPGVTLHIGSTALTDALNEVGIAITYGDDDFNGTMSLLWDWNNGAGQGSNINDTTQHARFGFFKNTGTFTTAWLTFDRDTPNNALAVNGSGELLILGTKAVRIVGVPASSTGQAGDTTGMIAHDANYYYYCISDYGSTTNIWKRVAWSSDTW